MKKYHLLYILCSLALIWGCSDSTFEQTGGTSATNAMLTVELSVPGMSATSATRAATAADEKEIETMDALVFDANDEFLYRATFSTMTTNTTGKTTVTFFVQKTTAEVHIYLLANARAQVEAATLTADDSYDVVMKKMLTDAVPTDADGIRRLKPPFPMWGRIALEKIEQTNSATANMIRSVARVDVGLNYQGDTPETATAQGLDNFELKEVYLYVARDKGYIAPDLDSLNVNYTKVIGPTLQPEGDRVTIEYTDGSTPTAEITDNLYAIEREMYIYEADGRLREDYDVTRIVVGGYYDGSTDLSYYTLYFTDQNTSGGFDSYGREILRNHNYRFNITKVTGPGSPTVDSKPQHMEATVVVWEAVDENQSFTGQYTIAGEATLWFDKSGEGSLEIFSDNPEPIELYSGDSYANIPEATSEDDADFGIIYKDYYEDGNEVPFKITRDATNTNIYLIEGQASVNQTAAERGGDDDFFYIKIGDDILKRIYLKQSEEDTPLQLSVTQRYLHFSRSGYAPYPEVENTTLDLEIEWEPIGAEITITDLDPNKLENTTGNPRIYPVADGLNTTGYISTVNKTGLTSGLITLDCNVPAYDPDDILERQSSTWEVTASYGNEVKTIYVTVERFDYGIDPKLSDVILDGDTYDFPVRANAKWEAVVKSEKGNVTTEEDMITGGVDASFGELLSIETVEIGTEVGQYAEPELITITFSSPEGVYPDVVKEYYGFPAVKVEENEGDDFRANSIIYSSSRMPLSIPAGKWAAASLEEGLIGSDIIVDKANGVDPTLFTGEIVWTDNSGWVPAAATSMHKAYVFACGSGTNTKLYVRRGDDNGNMVVALRKDDYTLSKWGNNIVWSWHIWGTDYDPEAEGSFTKNNDAAVIGKQEYWLTRELGAFADDWAGGGKDFTTLSGIYYTDPVSGLCYQFGRKDPFSQKVMYNSEGNAITKSIVPSSGINQNAAKTSIIYPEQLMHEDFWSGTYTSNLQESWGGTSGQKRRAFDPCPYGHRVSNWDIEGVRMMEKWTGTTTLPEYFSEAAPTLLLGIETGDYYGGKQPRTGYIVGTTFENSSGKNQWLADGARNTSSTDYYNSTLYLRHYSYTPNNGSLGTAVIRPSNALKIRCVKEQQ